MSQSSLDPQDRQKPLSDARIEGQGIENIPRRVLIVDDNLAVVKMASLMMKLLGHEVRSASDGQEGIEVAAEFLPDVVFMDLGMPRMNGYDAARHIREQPWGERMLLVAISGWDEDEARKRSKEAGFDHHLAKPAETSVLRRLIQESKR